MARRPSAAGMDIFCRDGVEGEGGIKLRKNSYYEDYTKTNKKTFNCILENIF